MGRLKVGENPLEDRTHHCCKSGRWPVARGERPIKLGNSWFSAKSIEVERWMFLAGGRALNGLGGGDFYQPQSNSEYRTR